MFTYNIILDICLLFKLPYCSLSVKQYCLITAWFASLRHDFFLLDRTILLKVMWLEALKASKLGSFWEVIDDGELQVNLCPSFIT